ncbi:MAG: DUF6198 family protein [Ruminococcus sp.]|jgi:uncharacterized membrane protein YczE
MEKLKRYIIFLIGLFINSLGVSLITKANLGTSPISSIPYVLSLNFPFTLGQFTIAFSLLLILIQLIILRRNFKAEHILQIPISVLFGYFIDLTMEMLFFIEPHSYISSLIYLLIGCLILGFGVYTEVLANVAMLPGESFVRAVSSTWKTDFGTTKIAFDVSMTVIAAALSLIFARRLEGVREGTIIAALLVGFIARILGRKLSFLESILFASDKRHAETALRHSTPSGGDCPPVIVIGRQYGSSGHSIGKALAKKLGFAFYDHDIIELTAGSTGYEPEFIKEHEENMTNSLFYDLMSQMYIYSDTQSSPRDEIFESEGNVIRNLAAKGNCIIIGRCADYFLRDRPNTLKVFVHAPEDFRAEHIMKKENISREEAIQKTRRVNRRRSDNYRYYTHRIWGHAQNYDLTVDASIGADAVQKLIAEMLKMKEAAI